MDYICLNTRKQYPGGKVAGSIYFFPIHKITLKLKFLGFFCGKS